MFKYFLNSCNVRKRIGGPNLQTKVTDATMTFKFWIWKHKFSTDFEKYFSIYKFVDRVHGITCFEFLLDCVHNLGLSNWKGTGHEDEMYEI